MVAKKSKNLNLKEKTIFRNDNREENMPRSYEKDKQRKTRRQEEFVWAQQFLSEFRQICKE